MRAAAIPPLATARARSAGHRCALHGICALLIAASFAPGAAAQAPPDKPPPPPPTPVQRQADERFQEGKALMEQGLVAAGCEKLAQSLELLRRGGTLLNLAVCREKEGKHALAFTLFQEALAVATADGRADRQELARRAIEEVRLELTWLQIAPAAGADTADLAITRDGEALPRPLWGTLVPVDPGAHTIAAIAPGKKRYEVAVTLDRPGDKKVVEIPALEPDPVQPPPTAAPLPPRPVRPAAAVSTPLRPDSPPAWMRPTGIAALAAGIAGLGAGGVLGVKAIVDGAETRRLCPGDVCTTDEGLGKHADARTAATVANVAVPAGLVAAGVGLFLLLWSPAPRAPSAKAPAGLWLAPAVGPQSAGASLGGAW
jgi:hypothetical protein